MASGPLHVGGTLASKHLRAHMYLKLAPPSTFVAELSDRVLTSYRHGGGLLVSAVLEMNIRDVKLPRWNLVSRD